LIIANEWESQIKVIEPSTMPMTALASSSIDLILHPERKREEIIKTEMLKYLATDTVLFHSIPQGGAGKAEKAGEAAAAAEGKIKELDDGHDPLLLKMEKERFLPLIKWMNEKYGPVDVVASNELRKAEHPDITYENVIKRLNKMNSWELVATEGFTHGCKSLVIALALVDRAINVHTAFHASRVEEEHQLARWGVVEGGHDIDRANLMVQLATASTLLWTTLSNRY
jgi:ATP synthase F1 complex assembly factor 2